MFVSDQDGILWTIDLSSGDKSVFADLSGLLVPLGAFGPGTFDERGFLGIAFHPGYAANGLLYTLTSEPVGGAADFSTMPTGVMPNHQAVVREWQVPNPGDPASIVDPASMRELLRFDEPQFNHNAGALNFGHDGMLYIALGDGGGRDDQGVGHVASGNAQDPSNPYGSILRIDPQGYNSANGEYGIPADNPFVDMDGYAAEVYAYGFRNPFRFSFDMATGDLYVGDVGQDDLEEVDVVIAGGNYGWHVKEGSFCFDPNGASPGFAYAQEPCPNEPAELDRSSGGIQHLRQPGRERGWPGGCGRFRLPRQRDPGSGRTLHLWRFFPVYHNWCQQRGAPVLLEQEEYRQSRRSQNQQDL